MIYFITLMRVVLGLAIGLQCREILDKIKLCFHLYYWGVIRDRRRDADHLVFLPLEIIVRALSVAFFLWGFWHLLMCQELNNF